MVNLKRKNVNIKLETLASLNKKHRPIINNLAKANCEVSCYYCQDRFKASQVKEWADNGNTAICPMCSIDAVLPFKATASDLRQMHDYWFMEGNLIFKTKDGKLSDVINKGDFYTEDSFDAYRKEILKI